MKYIILFLVTLTSITYAQIPFGDSIMPFGAYSTTPAPADWSTHYYEEDAFLDSLNDSLGFNQLLTGLFTPAVAGRFAQHGIYAYPRCTREDPDDELDAQVKYAETIYFLCEPESSSYYNITFETDNWTSSGDYIYSNSALLKGCEFSHPNKYSDLNDGEKVNYYPSFYMKIDTTNATDDVVGIFTVIRHWFNDSSDNTVIFIDTVLISELPDTVFNGFYEYEFNNDPDSLLMPDMTSHTGRNYFIQCSNDTTGSASVKYYYQPMSNITTYLDCFVVHCQEGENLVGGRFAEPNTEIATAIRQITGNDAFKDSVLGYYIKDTQHAGNFRPYAYINGLIKDTTLAGWGYSVEASSWCYFGSTERFRDVVRIVNPEKLWVYIYPLYTSTLYTGYTSSSTDGLQFDLNKNLTTTCDSIMLVLSEHDTEEWLFTPQAWYNATPESGGDKIRRPTRAETCCITYIGMCYHPTSILYWKLDSIYPESGSQGILQNDKTPRDGIYDAIAYDINPYIKAIDEYYMSLEWQRAYCVSPAFYGFTPPAEGLFTSIEVMSSIGLTSENAIYPADDGWFHVGEFKDTTTGEDYFMIVNRSCSMNSDDSTEATPVTVLMEFNRSALGNPNSLFITDVAASTRLADGDTGWVAVPEKTYSTIMPDFPEEGDSSLYFTTVLRAGEGRLFKVQDLQVTPLLSGYVCQGEFNFDESYTVSDSLRFKNPCKVNFSSYDTLVVKGILRTSGCDDETLGRVTFACHPDSQWIGVRFLSSDAVGDLNYCDFNYVNQYIPQIYIDSSAVVEINNCILDDGNIPIQVKNSGYLKATGCNFNNCGTSIYNPSGDSVYVDDCEFINDSNGIVSYTGKLDISGTQFSDVDYNGVYTSGGEISVTDCAFDTVGIYGIYASNSTISIADCVFDTIGEYGIYASRSNLSVSDCDFSLIEYYGIYTNSSESVINGCEFDEAGNYAIYINEGTGVAGDSILNCTIERTETPQYSSSQYCIRADDSETIYMEGCSLSDYKTGGLYLDGTDAVLRKSDFLDNYTYGVYQINDSNIDLEDCEFTESIIGIDCYSSYAPKLRWCKFDNNMVGFVSRGGISPDLGTAADSGFIDFEDCTNHYIYFFNSGSDTCWAIGNYFGSSGPSTSMFFGNPLYYTPYLDSLPEHEYNKQSSEVIIPFIYEIKANYPNPFNPTTNISYSLAEAGYTTIKLYNILGQEITKLVEEYKQPGVYNVVWDGKNANGKPVATGVYFYRITSGDFVDSKKMLLLR